MCDVPKRIADAILSVALTVFALYLCFTVPKMCSGPSVTSEPISDSRRIADSLEVDSVWRADSAFEDSIDRGLIRVIYIEREEESDDGRWDPPR